MAAPAVTCPVSITDDTIRLDFPPAFTDEEFEMFCNAFVFLFMGAEERRLVYTDIISRAPNTPVRHATLEFMYRVMDPEKTKPGLRCIVINLLDFKSNGNPARVALLASKLLPYISVFGKVAQGTGIATANPAIEAHARDIAGKLKTDLDAMFVTRSVEDAEKLARAHVAKVVDAQAAAAADGRVSLRRMRTTM